MFLGLNLRNVGLLGGLTPPSPVGGVATFPYNGSLENLRQGFLVPNGVTSVTAHVWGDGSFAGGTANTTGSFVRGTFSVAAGTKIEVRNPWGRGAPGGGGYAMVLYPSGSLVASTGGYTSILVAGGAGGAGFAIDGSATPGGNAGLSGVSAPDYLAFALGGGKGAATGAGGAGGVGVNNGVAGSFLQGGDGGVGGAGGGGGGWYGGGGGAGQDTPSFIGAGGGGGSSFVAGCSNVTNTGIVFDDPYWNGSASVTGGGGYVVLVYS